MTTKNMTILCLFLFLVLASAYLIAADAVIGMVATLASVITIGGGIMLSVYVAGAAIIIVFKVLQSNELWLTSKAQRRLVEKDANSITATRDSQIFLRGDPEKWTAMHLPGPDAAPLELASWQMFHNPPRQLPAGPQQELSVEGRWPERVDLLDLLPPGGCSISNVVIGATLQNGQMRTISAPLSELIHIVCAGASGWGKSMAIRSIAYQLAMAPEPIDLVLMDREGATFSPFHSCDKLMYPLADEDNDIIAILHSLVEEMESRKKLFIEYPTVEKLDDYNRQSGEPLSPIMCMIDEATTLMEIKKVKTGIKTLAQRSRKYGIYLLLAGQSMKADTIDTAWRDQFSTILQLKTNSRAQSQILLQSSVAHRISQRGRGYAILSGREMMEVQSPYFTLDMVKGELGNGQGNSQQKLSFPKQIAPPDEDQIIKDLIAEGVNNNQICKRMGLTPGGKQYARIDAVRDRNGLN